MPSTVRVIGEYEETNVPSSVLDELEHILNASWNDRLYGEKVVGNTQRFMDIDRYRSTVKSAQYVGVIQTPALRLTVLPKIFGERDAETEAERVTRSSKNLLYFLSYTKNLKLPSSTIGAFEKQPRMDFFEVFIRLFAGYTFKVMKRHLYKTYEVVESNGSFVRGRIDFDKHLRANVFRNRMDRVACTYDLFHENVLFNRIVKFVASSLIRQTTDGENRRMLRRLLALLADVDIRHCTRHDCDKVVLQKTQSDLAPILDYCRLFLSNSLVQLNAKNTNIFCFLLDMNRLFEEFVSGFLETHTELFTKGIVTPQKKAILTEEGYFLMYFDIFIEEQSKPPLLIDTKYKRVDFEAADSRYGPAQSDLYQMVTYAVRSGCDKVALLYPRYDDQDLTSPVRFTIRDSSSGRLITIVAAQLDLTMLPEGKDACDREVGRQFESLLEEIKR